MPKRRRAWASWNFLRWQRQGTAVNDVAVTYWMNELQGIDDDKPLFVSLNPPFEPDPALTFGKYLCEHPQYNAAAFAAQKRLERHSGAAPHLVLRRLDRIRLPRGRITVRACGCRSAGCDRAVARTAARTGTGRGVAMPQSANAKSDAIEADAAALYFGEVMHARLKPIGHRFSYRVMSLLIDLDRLDDADRQTPLCSA